MRLRDEGMARADEAADEEWKALAKSAVLWCARQLRPFTSDDVWARMLAVDEERARAREPRALGAVISKAYRDKFIEPTGEYRPSDRPETHRNPKRVWITATP